VDRTTAAAKAREDPPALADEGAVAVDPFGDDRRRGTDA
jgi:hypothetical protein